MPVFNPQLIKIIILLLGTSVVLSPISQQPKQAGKATNKIINEIVKKTYDNQIMNPNYKPKKKLPIIAGYKKGANPLPKGTTSTQTYKNIWNSLKKELGFK